MHVVRRFELAAALAAAACGIAGVALRFTVWPRPPCIEYKVPGDGALISGRPGYGCDEWLPSVTWDGYLQLGLVVVGAAMAAVGCAIVYGALRHARDGRDAGRATLLIATAALLILAFHYGWEIGVTEIAASVLAIVASALALAPARDEARSM
jgi:hypothetical protein